MAMALQSSRLLLCFLLLINDAQLGFGSTEKSGSGRDKPPLEPEDKVRFLPESYEKPNLGLFTNEGQPGFLRELEDESGILRDTDNKGESSVEKFVCRSEERLLCPVSCFRSAPVCGEDGTTYWCGCPEAMCAGVKVVHEGFCSLRNSGGSFFYSGQALLLIHTVWLALLLMSVLAGIW